MGDFTLKETFGNVQKYLCLSEQVGCYWHPVPTGRPGMMPTIQTQTGQPPPQRMTWLKMSVVRRLRSFVLVCMMTDHLVHSSARQPIHMETRSTKIGSLQKLSQWGKRHLKNQLSCEDSPSALPHGLECFDLGRKCSRRVVLSPTNYG